MRILIGTSNKGKIVDMSHALQDLRIEVLSPTDFGITEAPPEHADTFRGNALEKARFYRGKTKLPVLTDDSGIIVEALNDELGVHTRRWGAGAKATDDEWVTFFLDRMKKEKNKRSRFECCLCFIDKAGVEHFFEGTCNGVITETLESSYLPGLPIAACFKPDGADQVYAAMGIEGKNQWSHRGRAMIKFVDYLKTTMA
jgi:XTP/dITP diphosphohydrolase